MTRKFVYAFGSRKCHHLHSWRQLNLWHFNHRQVVPTHNVQHRRLSQWHFHKWRLDRDNDTLEVTSWLMISPDLAFHLCLEFLQQHCYIRDRRSFLWPETLNEQSSGVLFLGGTSPGLFFLCFRLFNTIITAVDSIGIKFANGRIRTEDLWYRKNLSTSCNTTIAQDTVLFKFKFTFSTSLRLEPGSSG